MHKYIQRAITVGPLLCVITICDSMAAIDIPRTECNQLGLTIGVRCDAQGTSGEAGAYYDPLCRGTNPNCRWRQCYNTCECTDDLSYDCCAAQAEDYTGYAASLWTKDAFHIYSRTVYLNNKNSLACDQITEYACEHGYYGFPENNAFGGQCLQCPDNGDSHGPGEKELALPSVEISNADIVDCFIAGGTDETGTYKWEEPGCVYIP